MGEGGIGFCVTKLERERASASLGWAGLASAGKAMMTNGMGHSGAGQWHVTAGRWTASAGRRVF